MSESRSKLSSGTLLYRTVNGALEVLLVHPAGNYNRRAPWGIPKGEPGATWRLAFRPGGLDVTPGAGNADVTFEADPAAIARMMYGRVTWQELQQDGRLTMSGDPEAADRFHSLFKGP